MVHQMMPLNGCAGVEETPVTAIVWHLQGYKCTLHLMLIIISHSSLLLALGFFPFLSFANHRWRTREAPNVNALPDDAKTPLPAPSRSPPPPGSPSEVSLRHPCSSVFEQGNASGKTLMIDPSSFIFDTSRDAELARKLFGDLNRDILEPSGDGKIIILDDSNDDTEAQEEKTVGIESTAATTPTSVDDAPAGAKISNTDD
jgi:hypothetical protein